MRNLRLLDIYRLTGPEVLQRWGWAGDETCGIFEMPSPIDRQLLRIIASAGEGWDHVSVSRRTRCPNWQEMEFVATSFFKDDEVAMQLHVPALDHINNHPFCLHWWRPQALQILRPPSFMVGLRNIDIKELLAPARTLRRGTRKCPATMRATNAERITENFGGSQC